MDEVFKALADPSRRKLLDELHRNNGQTLGQLCELLDMTRQASDQASRHSGSGEPCRHRVARTREAALPQSDAVARDLRTLGWQIRTPPPPGVERLEKESRTKQRINKAMEKPKFVYVTYINTTPEKLWEALTTTDLIRQYWSGRTNEGRAQFWKAIRPKAN
jgi:hypothetical protein